MRRSRVRAFTTVVVAVVLGSSARAGADENLGSAVARMAKVGACWSPSFSPDGSHLAFVSNLSSIPQVWIVPTQGGWPRLVTSLEDQVGALTWSPDGDWLAFSLAPGGGMNAQVYLVHPDGTGLRRLTDGGKENNWLGDWSHDGRVLTLASNRDGPESMDAYTYVLESGRLDLVARNHGIGLITELSRDGRRAGIWRMKSRSSDDVFVRDLATGHEHLLTPHDGPGSFGGGMFSPDGDTLYLSSDQGRDLVALGRVRLDATGAPGPIEVIASRDDAELQTFEVTGDGRRQC